MSAVPMPPTIFFYLSKNGKRYVKWAPVTLNTDLTPAVLTAYKVYRSTNPNLETFTLVRTINTIDAQGSIDTFFTEEVQGFYGYQITALNSAGESLPTLTKTVDSTIDLDAQ